MSATPQMPPATGKVCLVTGVTSGIGNAVAWRLASAGAATALLARNRQEGERLIADIKKETGNQSVELLVCDLSSQAAIRKAVQEFKQRHKQLHVLVNNAAVFTAKRLVTADGLELMFATNYLAPFLLTNLLLDELKSSAPSRVINVTAPSTVKPNLDDLQSERKFSSPTAFGASTAAKLLLTFALDRRLKGTGVTVNAFHPGLVRGTRLMHQAPAPMRIFSSVLNVFAKGPQAAADGLAQLALSKEFESVSGELIHNGKAIEAPFKEDVDLQERLWQISEKLTGMNG